MNRLCNYLAGGVMMTCLIVITGCQAPPVQPDAGQPTMTQEQARKHAIEQIVRSAGSDDPYLRTNAIEAGQLLPDRIMQLAQLGLEDDHEAVRFGAVATIGKLRLKQLADRVRAMGDDPSPSVRAAVLFALLRCREEVDITPMADMLVQPDPSLRGNVALLLGQLEDPSAVALLKSASRYQPVRQVSHDHEAIVRIQISEAMVRLGDESALEVIRAGTASQFGEVRIISVRMLGQLIDRKYARRFGGLLNQNPIELRIAAAEALAHLGDESGLPVVLEGSRFPETSARAQAALALGLFRDGKARHRRQAMLQDPQEQVRLAAAAAILAAKWQ